MFVVIVGAGLTGRYLAEELIRDNNKVVIIERDPELAAIAARELGIKVTEGDGDDPIILQEAGVRGADVLIAVTGDDEDNLVSCTLAKFEFHVGRVLARVNNPAHEWMFGKDMGVDIVISQAPLIAKLLEEEATLGDIVTLLKLREGEMAVVEKPISEGSRVIGHQIREVGFPEDAACVAVLRDGRVMVPRPDLVIQAGDRVIVLTKIEREQDVSNALR